MRIAIVNDVKIAVEALRRIVKTNPKYEIAWIAYDGIEAVEKCAKDTPDLILMDLVMPNMNGIEATRCIMKNSPCAILIVTSTVSTHTSKIFEAMGFGALDVIKTPGLDMNRKDLGGTDLLKKIERISFLIGNFSDRQRKILEIPAPKFPSRSLLPPLVVIGASTGGPKALATIISHFSKNLPFATVIIQHLDEQFAQGFAKWLSAQTSQFIQVAQEKMQIVPGSIFIAGKNDHLTITKEHQLHYVKDPLGSPYCPSVDIFFNSVAYNWPVKSVGILLTGMGMDGAVGLKTLKDNGWTTIAQREDTCVVYGMPRAAVALGAATTILPLDGIGPTIVEMFKEIK